MTSNYVPHAAGHLDGSTIGHPDCEVCTDLFATRQRDVLAAARVVRDSVHLNSETPGSKDPILGDTGFSRAELALAYVQNVHAEYATAEDFDNRYQGVYETFREFADQLADDVILDESGLAANHAMRMYFDYDAYARDLLLGGDYTSVDLPRSYQVAVFNNHG